MAAGDMTRFTHNQVSNTFTVGDPAVQPSYGQRHRKAYLDDDAFSRLQEALMGNPEAGDMKEPVDCARCASAIPVELRASAGVFA